MYADNVLTNLAITAAEDKLTSMQWTTVATTAGAVDVITFTLPDYAHSFKVYASAAIRYAINETPVAVSTATFVIGGIAPATTWVTKTIPDGIARTLQCLAGATGVTIQVEAF